MTAAQETPRLASVTVTHSCGHEVPRPITSYNYATKKAKTLTNVEWLVEMEAPQAIIKSISKLVEQETLKTVAYWSDKTCPTCYWLGRV